LAAAAAHAETTDVISCRGAELELFDLQSEAVRDQLRNALATTRLAHCSSHDIAERVRAVAGDRLATRVIPPGASPDDVAVKRTGPVRIVGHGNLTWLSGFDYLLAALARLRARNVPFEATVCGDGELLAPLRFSCGDMGLGSAVQFPARTDIVELREALRRADVFVVTSHYETIHETAVEAMALGVPVIATRVGGMSELIHDGQNGILVEPRDIEGIAQAIAGLDRERARELGKAARAHVAASFSLVAELDAIETMYRDIRRDES
jgi:glycosyltransferase involved in cell wall biosynthesis